MTATLQKCHPDCRLCVGTGEVCVNHLDRAWLDGSCCGAAPVPCPAIVARAERRT